MRLQFQTVDVFTGTQFVGNPLAVVLNAEGLSTGQMQAIAAEFNLAETTFVLPPQGPRAHGRSADLHPAQRDAVRRPSQCRHRLRAGARRRQLRPAGQRRPCRLRGKSRPGPDRDLARRRDGGGFETRVTAAALRSARRLRANWWHRRAGSRSPISRPPTIAHCIASCGAPFILAELKSRTALLGANPNADVFRLEVAQTSGRQHHDLCPGPGGRHRHPRADVCAAPQHSRGSGDRRRQRRADRPARPAAPGGEPLVVEDDRARRRDGTAEHPAGARPRRKTARLPRPRSAAAACR